MIYFINKNTLDVWAYETIDDAKQHNNDFNSLVECAKPIDTHFRKYDFKNREWVIDVGAQNKAFEQDNITFFTSEIRRITNALEILSDAIEFEEATNNEIAQSKSLRKYRLDLSRVPNQTAWPLNPTWPECPNFFLNLRSNHENST